MIGTVTTVTENYDVVGIERPVGVLMPCDVVMGLQPVAFATSVALTPIISSPHGLTAQMLPFPAFVESSLQNILPESFLVTSVV